MNKSNGNYLLAVMIAVIAMIAMCGIGSAGHIGVSKNTVPSGAEYKIGDTIEYNMSVQVLNTAPSGYNFTVDVYDEYPNGTVELLEDDLFLTEDGPDIKYYTRWYVVAESDISDGKVTNKINATGVDSLTDNVHASTDCTSNIVSNPVAMLDGTNVCYCTYTEFDGSGSYDPDGAIESYKWDFENDGTYDRVGTSPTTSYHYPAPGTYTAKLTVVDNDGLEDSDTTTVEVYGHPTANASATPTSLPVGGGTVTFDGTGSIAYPDTTIVSYTWSIPGVGTYNTATVGPVFIDHPITATLTVVDNNDCTDTDTVRIDVDFGEEVPILTPAGMLALIGLLGIVGGSRILRRGRRS